MKKILKYEIVERPYPRQLTEAVNEMIELGWQPRGAVLKRRNTLAQNMVYLGEEIV